MRRLPAATALFTLLAGPALAQAPICGGISVVGEWLGGEEGASDLAASDGAFEMDGKVPIAGHLVRMFTLSETADVRIDARALPDGDPYMSLYDADGREVASDDDSLGAFGSRVDVSLAPGTYRLAVRSYESGVTDVAVAVGLADADFGEDPRAPAVSSPDADPLTPQGGTGAGCFEDGMARLGDLITTEALQDGIEATASAAAAPAYGFSLLEEAGVTITASSLDGDPMIRLVDIDGNVVAENDDFDGLNSQLNFGDPLASALYCLELEDLNGDGNDITVTLGAFDPDADRARRLALAEFAPTEADGVAVTDLGAVETSQLVEVDMGAGTQWYRFELPEGGLLLTEAIGDGADPVVTLFDRVGRKVGENDDGADGLDSFLVSRLLPGRYTLAVRLVDSGDGGGDGAGTVRVLMERYVPAK